MANDHAAHRKAVPQLASGPRNFEAAAAAAVGLARRDKDVPAAFGGNKIGAEMKSAHAQHGLAHVTLSLAESSTRKHLENIDGEWQRILRGLGAALTSQPWAKL